MNKTIIIFIIIIQSSLCYADEWGKKEKIYASTFTIISLIDWGQTRDIVMKQDKGYYERTNLILKTNPTLRDVDTYFPIAIGLSLLSAHYMNNKWKRVFLGSLVIMELGYISGNHHIGLRINY